MGMKRKFRSHGASLADTAKRLWMQDNRDLTSAIYSAVASRSTQGRPLTKPERMRDYQREVADKWKLEPRRDAYFSRARQGEIPQKYSKGRPQKTRKEKVKGEATIWDHLMSASHSSQSQEQREAPLAAGAREWLRQLDGDTWSRMPADLKAVTGDSQSTESLAKTVLEDSLEESATVPAQEWELAEKTGLTTDGQEGVAEATAAEKALSERVKEAGEVGTGGGSGEAEAGGGGRELVGRVTAAVERWLDFAEAEAASRERTRVHQALEKWLGEVEGLGAGAGKESKGVGGSGSGAAPPWRRRGGLGDGEGPGAARGVAAGAAGSAAAGMAARAVAVEVRAGDGSEQQKGSERRGDSETQDGNHRKGEQKANYDPDLFKRQLDRHGTTAEQQLRGILGQAAKAGLYVNESQVTVLFQSGQISGVSIKSNSGGGSVGFYFGAQLKAVITGNSRDTKLALLELVKPFTKPWPSKRVFIPSPSEAMAALGC